MAFLRVSIDTRRPEVRTPCDTTVQDITAHDITVHDVIVRHPHLVKPESAVTRLSASTSAPAPSTSAVRARPARLGTLEMSEATTIRSLRRVPAGPA
jgi:hypothetical protein